MKNKKVKFMTAVATLVLAMFVIGATYSYFSMQGTDQKSADIRVGTATTDLLTFKMGDPINIEITQDNFTTGAGNKTSSTTTTATFTATNSASIEKSSARYNVYLLLETNGFEYTTKEATPEVLFKITDPNGNEVENVTGLVHTENGFDITTRTGGFLISADYYIEATRGNTVSQEWTAELIFVNLDTEQMKNAGKSLSGKLLLTADQLSNYELAQINSVDPETTSNSITTYLNITEGTAEIDKYYYAIEKVSSDVTSYLETNNNTVKLSSNYIDARSSIVRLAKSSTKFNEADTPYYSFDNLQEETTYKIYAYAVDKNKMKTNLYETEAKTTVNYTFPKINYITYLPALNSITLSVNAKQGDNEIVKYYYSKDNGETYEESTSNTYVFSNLLDSTSYQIKVKVQDSAGAYSTEYYKPVTTDIYISPTITTVSSSTTYNEITLNTTTQNGNNAVSKYYYAIDGGAYTLGNSSYTFSNLEENSTHTIKVKVEDTIGKMSNEYVLNVTTDSYVLPTITSVITDTTTDANAITIDVTAEKGSENITEYYYSKDGGSNYVKSTSSSYTFSNLTGKTKYYLKVYVKDSNGRSSNEYSLSTITTGEVFVSSISTISKTNGAYDTSKSENTNDTTSMFVTMPAASTISYEISIKNLSNTDYILKEVQAILNTNTNIENDIELKQKIIIGSNLKKTIVITLENNTDSEQVGKLILQYYFVKNNFTVTFDANGGTVATLSKNVSYGETYGNLPVPTRDGYTFKGWNGKNKLNLSQYSYESDYYYVDKDIVKIIKTDTLSLINIGKTPSLIIGNEYTISASIEGSFDGRCYAFFFNDLYFDSCKNGRCINNYIVTSLEGDKTRLYILQNHSYASINIYPITDEVIFSNIQIEEGSVATEYEPYYVTSDVKVTQVKNHTLTAIWEEN